MFEDVYNVYNGFKHLHSRRNSEPLRKAILRAWTRERRFDDMPRREIDTRQRETTGIAYMYVAGDNTLPHGLLC
jgi:hypothetical protein